MRHLLLFLALVLCIGSGQAQSQRPQEKGFKVGLSYAMPMIGNKSNLYEYYYDQKAQRPQHIVLSLGYRYQENWAAGVSLYIPSSVFKPTEPVNKILKRHTRDGFETWAGELWLRRTLLRLNRLSIDLKASAYWGRLNVPKGALWESSANSPNELRGGNQEIWERAWQEAYDDLYPYRWKLGLSPQINLDLSARLSMHLSYGFVGIFSHKNVTFSSRKDDKLFHFGFSDNPALSNGLRVGLSFKL